MGKVGNWGWMSGWRRVIRCWNGRYDMWSLCFIVNSHRNSYFPRNTLPSRCTCSKYPNESIFIISTSYHVYHILDPVEADQDASKMQMVDVTNLGRQWVYQTKSEISLGNIAIIIISDSLPCPGHVHAEIGRDPHRRDYTPFQQDHSVPAPATSEINSVIAAAPGFRSVLLRAVVEDGVNEHATARVAQDAHEARGADDLSLVEGD